MNFYPFIRALLFQINAEYAHKLSLSAVRVVGEIGPINSLLRKVYHTSPRSVRAFGLNFSNPIGLAAGYDKDGLGWRGLACLGFGHIEIGTVTPRPQAGNPMPWLFRLPEDQALINRMGFPGKGAEFVLQQISRPRPKGLVLGVNIGKNKDTPLETAAEDYVYLLRLFARQADYLTINVSSPNTIGLRQLQERQALERLLVQLCDENESLTNTGSQKVPMLVKLAPDLTDAQLEDALEAILAAHMDGVIATNTTIRRDGLRSKNARENGGLSGVPLFEQSLTIVHKIHKITSGKLPVIGVGGISDATSVKKMLDAGATLIQVYTGLIYQGPGLVKTILSEFPKY